MKLKNHISLLLALLMLVAVLAGCGSENNTTNETTPSGESTQSSETAAPATTQSPETTATADNTGAYQPVRLKTLIVL